MRSTWGLLVLAALAACTEPAVSERYRAERDLHRIEAPYLRARFEEQIETRRQWRQLAADFEAVASRITRTPTDDLRRIEGRAWLRAAECHTAALDSGRAELILANLAASHADLPRVFGEVSFRLGRINEARGEYLAALGHYEDVVERVEPDPGPDPTEYRDPDAMPEERTADDFVLELPLRMARIASRDTTLSDPGRHYGRAHEYYAARVDDPSPFVRVDATILLAETEADQGEFSVAARRLRELEDHIPYVVRTRHTPDEVRLRAFEYAVEEWVWGRATTDSIRTELGALIDDYPVGSAAAGALYAVAEGAARRGEIVPAMADLRRLRRDQPTSPLAPEAELLQAQLLVRAGQWLDALQVLRTLAHEFPTSRAALRAPLEIAAHHRQTGDLAREAVVLQEAEQTYREVLERYPQGEHSYFVREKLVQTYTLQGRELDAIDQLLAMCDEVAAPAQRPGLLVDAARRAEVQLGQPARAADILERLAEEFPNTRIGRWSVRHARRLRSANNG